PLKLRKSTIVATPRLSGAPLGLECMTTQMIPVGRHTLFLARVVQIHVAPSLYRERGLHKALLQPASRGGDLGRAASQAEWMRRLSPGALRLPPTRRGERTHGRLVNHSHVRRTYPS